MCMSAKTKTQENTVIVPGKSVYINSGFTNPLSFFFFCYDMIFTFPDVNFCVY
jgi:hypothetical protein